jgi:hypothetical protein
VLIVCSTCIAFIPIIPHTDAVSTDSDALQINTSASATTASTATSDTHVKRSSILKSPLSKISTPIRNLSITGMSGLLTAKSQHNNSLTKSSHRSSSGTLNIDDVHITTSVTKALRALLQQLQYCAALITAGQIETTTHTHTKTKTDNKHSKQESFDYTAASNTDKSSTEGVVDKQLLEQDSYESGRYTVASVLCKLIANEFVQGELQTNILSTSENHSQAAQVSSVHMHPTYIYLLLQVPNRCVYIMIFLVAYSIFCASMC